MKNIFQKFLTNKKNRKLTIGNQNEFQGIISPVSPVAIVDEPITFSSDVDFTNANVIGIDTTPDTSGLWNLDGNSIQSGDFIGTTNNQPLVLKTNGTEVAVFPSSQFGTIKIGKNQGLADGIIIGNNTNINLSGGENLFLGSNICNFAGNNTGATGDDVILGLNAGQLHTGYRNFLGGKDAAKRVYCNDSVHIGTNVSNVAGNPADKALEGFILGFGWEETTPGVLWTKTIPDTDPLVLTYNINTAYPYTPISKSFKVITNATVTAGSLQVRDYNTSQLITTITSTGVYESVISSANFINVGFVPSADFQGSITPTLRTNLLNVVDRVVIIGSEAKPKDDLDTNEIVIGYNAIGNGSNTATLGNDSIANTYLKGNLQLPAYGDGNVTGTATKLLGVDTNGKVVETPYAGYKVYTARVMFNGVDGFPVPTILENTLGGSPAWSKDDTGIYNIVLSNAFTTGKVFISHTQVSTTNTKQIIQEINSSTLQINNYDLTSTPALSDITTTTPMFVEIRVYP
jgi:hypothetical protein